MHYPQHEISNHIDNRPEDALERVAQHLAEEPACAAAWVDAARCALRLGNTASARSYMMRALHLEPDLVRLDSLIARLA